ncbi:hypothetical protein [Rhodococcus oxybenzonivorans]|uniref:hypothetical protein n=1 Tax=Rhodococcus oxybenzonivorans TaxID=1990687 RepID=UPI001E405E7E|nr:hypothetical protein [Rhodococcus oxybenzonivorans]
MIRTSSLFSAERAPCGRVVDGRRHQENDDEGLRIDDRTYACGCRMIRHEFHDGSVRIKTVRHDGKVLKDEHSGNHEA